MQTNINWKTVGISLAAAIGSLGVLGVLAVPVHGVAGSWLRWFDLDRELNVVTAVSTMLLIGCGWLTAKLVRSGELRRVAFALAAFFIFMGIDEMLKVHETLEKITGIDWQILYLPLVMVAGAGWVYVWWTGRGLTRWLWFGGAACWVVSQGLEAVQWGGLTGDDSVKVASYTVLMVSEELLEMTGSSLFLLALFRRRWPEGLEFRRCEAMGDRPEVEL